ncbi:MAG: hypothetical protein AB7O52_06680 [Planctomycetota bacterium]
MERREFNKLIAAAVGGLMAGATLGGCTGTGSKSATTKGAAKHACKGHNECKGQGGCGSGNNGCAGKNDCKGQGGCATASRHDCAGKNDCKGQGGCGSGNNGCAGKNDCKGQGGCAVPIAKH